MSASRLVLVPILVGSLAASLLACGGAEDEGESSSPVDVRRITLPSGTVRYEVVGDLAIYQRDIVLGTVDEVEARAIELGGEVGLDEGIAMSRSGLIGIENSPCRALAVLSLGFAFGFQDHRWPDGIVPFVIGDNYTAVERTQVEDLMRQAAAHYADNTSLRLVPRTTQSAFIRIRDFQGGENPGNRACGSSKLGRQGGRQDLRFAPSLGGLGCLMHELAHAMGVAHEQARSDRDSFVRIISDNIVSGRGHNFDKEMTCAFDDFGDYDFDSIMHYWAGAFMRPGLTCTDADRSGCTIVPVDPSVSVSRLGSNRGALSDGDREGLCEMYGNPTRIFLREGGAVWDEGRVANYTMGAIPEIEVDYRFRGVLEPTEVLVSSDLDGDLRSVRISTGSDRSLSLPGLSAGRHVLTFRFDTYCPTELTREIVVSPHLEIVSPSDGATIPRGRPAGLRVRLGGLGPVGTVEWSSSLEPDLGSSTNETHSAELPVGRQRITARARFPDGTTLQDSIEVTVENLAPGIEIVAPTTGTDVCVGQSIGLRARATSLDLDPVTVSWLVDGVSIGDGDALDFTFPEVGLREVSATATDPLGASDSDTVMVNVRGCSSTPPEISVTWPRSEQTPGPGRDGQFFWDDYDPGRGLWFKRLRPVAFATDAEDGDLSGASVVWTTSRTDIQPAELGTGLRPTLRLYGGCFGDEHVITVRATDSDGNTSFQTYQVFVYQVC